MQVNQIYELLQKISPFELQEKWDNSGLNLGSPHQEIQQIYATLEIDLALAQNIKPNSLIITHHPLIFSPLKTLNPHTYPCNIASILLAKNCSVIAMHTNFDSTHLNYYFATEILGLKNLEQKGITLKAQIPSTSFESLLENIKTQTKLSALTALKSSDTIHTLYIVCGSGMSALSSIPPYSQSCLITGDIKHHASMEAYSLGISLIDVGHYESEKFFAQIIYKTLQNFGYEVIIHNLENPLRLC